MWGSTFVPQKIAMQDWSALQFTSFRFLIGGIILFSFIKFSPKNVIEDKKSGEYRLSHHLDLKTGFYKGRQVLDPKD